MTSETRADTGMQMRERIELLRPSLLESHGAAVAEFERLSYDQIARIEGVRVGTVKSRINRARNKLMEALRQFGEVP